nr:unnamed protein product [Callosobruchus analis]
MALLNDPEGSSLMGDTDVHELLQEIEQEMAQEALADEARRHEEDSRNEVEDIVNRHLAPCTICHELCPDAGQICEVCRARFGEELED